LALAEGRVELLTRKANDLEAENDEIKFKLKSATKPPPKVVNVNLCAHYEGQSKFNVDDLMK
jgi:hypothetical protein